MPLLPWDGWGLIDRREEDLSAADLTFRDHVSSASAAEIDYGYVRKSFASDDCLRVPQVINSYTENGEIQVELAMEAPIE